MGKWIDYETDASTGKPYLWKCDECGEEVETRWNYCPECGDPKTSNGKSIGTLVKALEQEHKKLREMQSATDTNVGTKETIYRQDAINAILNITNCKSVRELFEYNQLHDLTDMWSGGVNDAIDAVISVESAQPETTTMTVGRSKGKTTMWYECDACGDPVDFNDNYCRNCGRKLIHE